MNKVRHGEGDPLRWTSLMSWARGGPRNVDWIQQIEDISDLDKSVFRSDSLTGVDPKENEERRGFGDDKYR